MWPMRPDMTRDECKKCLRCLELEAYGNMVSVLRAQGPFTNDKQRLLQELANALHISNERHRAEIRRAVNDEKLTTIAEQLNGPNTGIDWTVEGRRTIPLLPRLKARSAYTMLANSLSLATAVANRKKPDRFVTVSRDSIAVETESQPQVKIDENLSIDITLCNVKRDLDKSETIQENSDLVENENMDNRDVIDKIVDKPKVLKLPEKRKYPSPLPMEPPNKILLLSNPVNHALLPIENQQASQIPQTTMQHQNLELISSTVDKISDSKGSITTSEHSNERVTVPSNKHITTISPSMSNTSNTKTVASIIQSKVNTTVVPTTSNVSPRKMHLEDKEAQPQDNTNNIQESQRSEYSSSNPSYKKQSNTSDAVVSSSSHLFTHTVTMCPSTTVSSGPGPPQSKQVPVTLVPKKLPSEQIATFNHQSTANTNVTINSKKVVNMPHYSNAKLSTKTNVIVIQKGNAKGVTLSHAGKEVVGKVIMGGTNLCVTSQHNASPISVQPHHISLNNGDQTKTALPLANSTQNTESIKINTGNATLKSLATHFREDNKALSQIFRSIRTLTSEPKTVIQNKNARLPKGERNNDADTIDRELFVKTDVITSTMEVYQPRKSNDANTKSQIRDLFDFSKQQKIFVRPKQMTNVQDADVEKPVVFAQFCVDNIAGNIRVEKFDEDMDTCDTTLDSTNKDASIKSQIADLFNLSKQQKILVRPKQITNVEDNVADNIRLEKSDKDMDTCDATQDSTNKNPQNFQCLLDNDENHEESTRLVVTMNQMEKQGDS